MAWHRHLGHLEEHIPERPNRIEPRAVKQQLKPYHPLTGLRKEMQEALSR